MSFWDPTSWGDNQGSTADSIVGKGAGGAKAAEDYARQNPNSGLGGVFNSVSDWLGQKQNQIGTNPYQGQWNNLIGQLSKQASGQGPSMAGDAFKQASDHAMQQQMALARGGTAGGARQAGMNMGQLGQGQAFGYANARLQEQMAAKQALMQALQGAGNAWWQPQQANQGQPNNLQTALSVGGNLLSDYAAIQSGGASTALTNKGK